MPFGYWGKVLVIYVGRKKTSELSLNEDFYRCFIGGRAAVANLMLKRELHKVEPLGPDNEIIIFTGPLTSSMVPGSSKVIWAARSPLTGGYLDGAVGGRLSYHLKRTGYDGLILSGVSQSHIFLEIINGQVEFKDASSIWGLGCYETEQKIRQVYGTEPSVSCIGPAGENKVHFAMVQTDFSHQVGRGGIGAVLGSKNIKAIVIEGKMALSFYNQQELYQKSVNLIETNAGSQQIQFRIKYGTLTTLDLNQKLGIAISHNFQNGSAERYDNDMNRDYIKEHHVVKNLSCLGCPVPCGMGSVVEHIGKEVIVGGPEYETMALLGTNIEVSSEGLVQLSWLCDDLGLDTITAGNILGYLMEVQETGELNPLELGFELKWGDVEASAEVLKMITYRRGLGEKLALGVRRFAEEMGLDQDKAIHVKGLELPGYDPRGSTGTALEYAVADRGGCHRRARPLQKEQEDDAFRLSYKEKGKYVADLEDNRSFLHALVLCDFLPKRYGLKVNELVELVNLATGWDLTSEEALMTGARAIQQARIFNIKCGVTGQEDTLPGRFFKEALREGASKGLTIDPQGFQHMKDDYYKARGWDDNGVPTHETLAKFGLEGFR